MALILMISSMYPCIPYMYLTNDRPYGTTSRIICDYEEVSCNMLDLNIKHIISIKLVRVSKYR